MIETYFSPIFYNFIKWCFWPQRRDEKFERETINIIIGTYSHSCYFLLAIVMSVLIIYKKLIGNRLALDRLSV